MLHGGGLKDTHVDSFEAVWKPGAELAADALTKVLPRSRLHLLRGLLGVQVHT